MLIMMDRYTVFIRIIQVYQRQLPYLCVLENATSFKTTNRMSSNHFQQKLQCNIMFIKNTEH